MEIKKMALIKVFLGDGNGIEKGRKWRNSECMVEAGLMIIRTIMFGVILCYIVLIKIKMPDGPVFFIQKRVGKNGRLFDCHKFRTMTMNHGGSSVSVAGDSRITPLGS